MLLSVGVSLYTSKAPSTASFSFAGGGGDDVYWRQRHGHQHRTWCLGLVSEEAKHSHYAILPYQSTNKGYPAHWKAKRMLLMSSVPLIYLWRGTSGLGTLTAFAQVVRYSELDHFATCSFRFSSINTSELGLYVSHLAGVCDALWCSRPLYCLKSSQMVGRLHGSLRYTPLVYCVNWGGESTLETRHHRNQGAS